MAICEQLDKVKKSRAVRGNREQRILVVPEMCEGCTAYMGEGYRCPVQKEPGWLWIHKKSCWSKRTDPAVGIRIGMDIKNYRNRMGER